MVKIKHYILIIIITTFSPHVHAFNWSKCSRGLIHKNYHSGAWEGLWQFVLNTTLSSAQFTSSTGGCAMLGQMSNKRKIFVAQNLERLETDSAKGDGEYLKTYASLSGCSATGYDQLKKSFQTNFTKIYGTSPDKPIPEIYDSMENILSSDLILKTTCKTDPI